MSKKKRERTLSDNVPMISRETTNYQLNLYGYPDDAFSREEKRHGIHGGDIETSLMLAGRPDVVRMGNAPNAVPATVAMAQEFKWLGAYRPAGFAWLTQDLHLTGAVGDATRAGVVRSSATRTSLVVTA